MRQLGRDGAGRARTGRRGLHPVAPRGGRDGRAQAGKSRTAVSHLITRHKRRAQEQGRHGAIDDGRMGMAAVRGIGVGWRDASGLRAAAVHGQPELWGRAKKRVLRSGDAWFAARAGSHICQLHQQKNRQPRRQRNLQAPEHHRRGGRQLHTLRGALQLSDRPAVCLQRLCFWQVFEL